MSQDWRKEVNHIVQKLTKHQIAEILVSSFELEDMPEIIAVNRGIVSIKGFAKISKKVFAFGIIFMKNKLEVTLVFGKQNLVKVKEISIENNEHGIDVFLTENREYLFSIYS